MSPKSVIKKEHVKTHRIFHSFEYAKPYLMMRACTASKPLNYLHCATVEALLRRG